MERYENIWKVPIWRCPKCGEEHYEEDVDLCSAPTEEASYADDELEPEEWLDTYYREIPIYLTTNTILTGFNLIVF